MLALKDVANADDINDIEGTVSMEHRYSSPILPTGLTESGVIDVTESFNGLPIDISSPRKNHGSYREELIAEHMEQAAAEEEAAMEQEMIKGALLEEAMEEQYYQQRMAEESMFAAAQEEEAMLRQQEEEEEIFYREEELRRMKAERGAGEEAEEAAEEALGESAPAVVGYEERLVAGGELFEVLLPQNSEGGEVGRAAADASPPGLQLRVEVVSDHVTHQPYHSPGMPGGDESEHEEAEAEVVDEACEGGVVDQRVSGGISQHGGSGVGLGFEKHDDDHDDDAHSVPDEEAEALNAHSVASSHVSAETDSARTRRSLFQSPDSEEVGDDCEQGGASSLERLGTREDELMGHGEEEGGGDEPSSAGESNPVVSWEQEKKDATPPARRILSRIVGANSDILDAASPTPVPPLSLDTSASPATAAAGDGDGNNPAAAAAAAAASSTHPDPHSNRGESWAEHRRAAVMGGLVGGDGSEPVVGEALPRTPVETAHSFAGGKPLVRTRTENENGGPASNAGAGGGGATAGDDTSNVGEDRSEDGSNGSGSGGASVGDCGDSNQEITVAGEEEKRQQQQQDIEAEEIKEGENADMEDGVEADEKIAEDEEGRKQHEQYEEKEEGQEQREDGGEGEEEEASLQGRSRWPGTDSRLVASTMALDGEMGLPTSPPRPFTLMPHSLSRAPTYFETLAKGSRIPRLRRRFRTSEDLTKGPLLLPPPPLERHDGGGGDHSDERENVNTGTVIFGQPISSLEGKTAGGGLKEESGFLSAFLVAAGLNPALAVRATASLRQQTHANTDPRLVLLPDLAPSTLLEPEENRNATVASLKRAGCRPSQVKAVLHLLKQTTFSSSSDQDQDSAFSVKSPAKRSTAAAAAAENGGSVTEEKGSMVGTPQYPPLPRVKAKQSKQEKQRKQAAVDSSGVAENQAPESLTPVVTPTKSQRKKKKLLDLKRQNGGEQPHDEQPSDRLLSSPREVDHDWVKGAVGGAMSQKKKTALSTTVQGAATPTKKGIEVESAGQPARRQKKNKKIARVDPTEWARARKEKAEKAKTTRDNHRYGM